MCGLVGVFGQIGQVQDKVFKQLLVLDSLRGDHSTGILSVSGSGVTTVLKKMGGPSEIAQYKQYDKIFLKANRVLMGHNRYATQGGVNNQNAHPFEFETLVGAHNGTLRNQKSLPDSHMFEVDSENLYHAIERDGVDSVIPKVDGAFSLTWYNKEEGTLHFLRNDERPMHMCLDVSGKNLYWASEPWMLEVALKRNSIKHGEIISTSVGQLYTYDVGDLSHKTGVPKPRTRGVSLYKPKSYSWPKNTKTYNKGRFIRTGETVSATYFGFQKGNTPSQDFLIMKSESLGNTIRVYVPYGSDEWDTLAGSSAGEEFRVKLRTYVPSTQPTFSYYRADPSSIVPVVYEGCGQKKLSRSEWEKAVQHGCCCCSDPIKSPEEVGAWFNDDDPICKVCLGDYPSIEEWLEGLCGGD